jgi:hypothetical protein
MADQQDKSYYEDDVVGMYQDSDGFFSFANVVYIFLGLVCFFVICVCLLNEEYGDRCGCCRHHDPESQQLGVENDQLVTQRSNAMQADQALQEERKQKYICFLRPSYTMLVTESDFRTESGDSSLVRTTDEGEATRKYKLDSKHCDLLELGQRGDASSSGSMNEGVNGSCFVESLLKIAEKADQQEEKKNHQEGGNIDHPGANKADVLVEADLLKSFSKPPVEAQVSSRTVETTSISEDDEEDEYQNDLELGHGHRRFLCLPVHDESGNPRKVDTECSICISEYEAGDEVVWSTRRLCPHAFHADCMLSWLSKGKKRCPICRHFFVPGHRVDDKDAIVQTEEADGAPPPSSVRPPLIHRPSTDEETTGVITSYSEYSDS